MTLCLGFSAEIMEDATFRTRLVELMKKSRRAVRMYGTVVSHGEPVSRFAESQTEEWRNVNSELLRLLSAAIDQPSQRRLLSDVIAIRDRFEQDAHIADREINKMQERLVAASQVGDFVKAAVIACDLVQLKARSQAAQAAFTEVDDVLQRSKLSAPALELGAHAAAQAESQQKLAKVIPLIRRTASL